MINLVKPKPINTVRKQIAVRMDYWSGVNENINKYLETGYTVAHVTVVDRTVLVIFNLPEIKDDSGQIQAIRRAAK